MSDEEVDGLARVVRAVRRVCDAPAPRGPVSTRIARLSRAVKAAGQQGQQVTLRARGLIQRYNEDHAKTKEDAIQLHSSEGSIAESGRGTRKKGSGTGSWKQWLPAALLRVCWGKRPRERVAQKVQKRMRLLKKTRTPKVRGAAPTASSTRSWARDMNASTTHIARVRSAMSELFLRVQEQELAVLPHVQEQWIQIALDETQEPVSLEARAQSAHVMCIHMKIVRLSASGQAPAAMQVVLPTVILPGTTTEDLYGGLIARLPASLETLRAKAANTTILFNSDSFSSCLKLYKCLRDMVPCLHCPCRMHQLCISMAGVVASSGLMASLYCGAHLLRRSRFQRVLRVRLESHLSDPEHFVLTYERRGPEAERHANAVWGLVWALISSHAKPGERVATPRAAAWRRLRKNLRGPLNDDKRVLHYCPFGCHASWQEAKKEILADLVALFLDSPPIVPAWNKWTKITPPLMWFAPLMQVHGLLAHMVGPLVSSLSQAVDMDNDAEEDEDSLVGLKNEKAFLREEYTRVKKFHRFATAPGVGMKLTSTLLALKPSLHVLGAFFDSATQTRPIAEELRLPARALELCQPSKSPAVSAINQLLTALSSEDHEPGSTCLIQRRIKHKFTN